MYRSSFIHSFCLTFNEYYNKLSYNISNHFTFFEYDTLLNSLYHINLLYCQNFNSSLVSDVKCELLTYDDLLLFIFFLPFNNITRSNLFFKN